MEAVQGRSMRDRGSRAGGERMPGGNAAFAGITGIGGLRHAVLHNALLAIQEADKCWDETLVLLRGDAVVRVPATLDELLAWFG